MKAMPRRTDQPYLQTHDQLKRLWEHANSSWGHINSLDQWRLHDYFQPTKDRPTPKLLAHKATGVPWPGSTPPTAHAAVRSVHQQAMPAGQATLGVRVVTVGA
jgi:hypothetical protein